MSELPVEFQIQKLVVIVADVQLLLVDLDKRLRVVEAQLAQQVSDERHEAGGFM